MDPILKIALIVGGVLIALMLLGVLVYVAFRNKRTPAMFGGMRHPKTQLQSIQDNLRGIWNADYAMDETKTLREKTDLWQQTAKEYLDLNMSAGNNNQFKDIMNDVLDEIRLGKGGFLTCDPDVTGCDRAKVATFWSK